MPVTFLAQHASRIRGAHRSERGTEADAHSRPCWSRIGPGGEVDSDIGDQGLDRIVTSEPNRRANEVVTSFAQRSTTAMVAHASRRRG